MTANQQIDGSAMARAALSFLLAAQDGAGAWKDFLLPAGHSNVWVTAFVGDVVALTQEAEAQQAARRGWQFLETVTTQEGGWSYNPLVPGDGDSTLWGLRLAERLGVEETPAARQAATFLQRHLRDGGLTTYADAAPVRRYIGLPPVVPFRGWTQAHVCVTAAGANLADYREPFREYLLTKQADDGRWPAYWWFDDEYATAEAVAALAGQAHTAADCEPEIAARIERAVGWARERVEVLCAAEGRLQPAFALAHGLRVLARAGDGASVRAQISAALTRLAAWQKPNGGWPASARLRVPRPDALVPDPAADWKMWAGMPAVPVSLESVLQHTFNNYSPDHFGVYTTATVLRALQELSTRRQM
ncbi:MAG TPA: squalene--hopene cyclase [Blastocatellia bacterium]|nr:squalene--hopene cyclase [Blastocatellia bacterium]